MPISTFRVFGLTPHHLFRELSGTFARLCHLVDESIGDMRGEVTQLDAEIAELDAVAGSAKNPAQQGKLRGQPAGLLRHQLPHRHQLGSHLSTCPVRSRDV